MLKSLRARLVLAIGVLLVLTWIAILIVGGAHMWDELEEGYDAELGQSALFVVAMVEALDVSHAGAGAAPMTNRSDDIPHGISSHNFNDHLVQVSKDGEMIFRSSTAPDNFLELSEGIQDVEIGGELWKVLRKTEAESGDIVVMGIRRHEVDSTIVATILAVLVPLAAAGFVSTVITFFLVSRLMRPLERWAHKIGDMSPYDTATLDDKSALLEVRPVLAALNRMLERVRSSITFERRFVRDAAHEIRTPLAAIKAQVEAGDWSGLSPEQESRMTKVLFGLRRATRLVNQLMDLARAEEARLPEREQRVEVGALVRDKLTEFLNSGAVTDRTRISLKATSDLLWLTGNPNDLEIVLNNLVDNAVKYAGAESSIDITLEHVGNRLVLKIEDDGPGIPAERQTDVFNRFVRLAPASSYGSGLGLALVKEIVAKLGGQVTLGQGERLKGLLVTVTLPAETVANDDIAAAEGSAPGQIRAAG